MHLIEAVPGDVVNNGYYYAMEKPTILVVDDERDFLRFMEDSLAKEGYETLTAPDGETGLAIAMAKNPDLLILDIFMPGLSGLEVLQRIREKNPRIRIILLTAAKEMLDKVRGLELGADDYVTKPFDFLELNARIRVLLRRPEAIRKETEFRFGEVAVNQIRREVTLKNCPVELTAKEFDLLLYFVEHEGESLSRDCLLDEVWGPEQFPTSRTIDVLVLHLRQKLEADPSTPQHFLTIRGFGYKFVAGS
ncbi:response regulator transcription factor [Nitrospinota bacterium]